MANVDMHCTAVGPDGRSSCTCGWSAPQSLFDPEGPARWHRLAVGATIANPLLTAFLEPVTEDELADPNCLGIESFIQRCRRDRLTAEYAWAIPTEPVLHKIAALSPICEMGCGSGYWASLLAKLGADVLAVDAHPPLGGKNNWHRSAAGFSGVTATLRHFTDIVAGDAATFVVPRSRALMLCWPPYNTSMASTALRRYRGNRVIYVGERGSGCTGDGAFHALLRRRWNQVACYEIPQWEGVHDAVYVFARRPSASTKTKSPKAGATKGRPPKAARRKSPTPKKAAKASTRVVAKRRKL
jgi:hypothetical protein